MEYQFNWNGAGQRGLSSPRDAVSTLARHALFGVHVLHGIQGELRRVQAHGACAVWHAKICGRDPLEDRLHFRRWLSQLSLIHISEPTRLLSISYAVFCLKKK